MALSRIIKIGDGVTTEFNVNFALGYISQDHVTARVGDEVDGLGAPVYRAITFNSLTMMDLSGDPPGLDVEVIFERTVPRDGLIVNFSDGDNLSDDNLDNMQLQCMMIAHEALDGRIGPIASDFDMNGFRIRNLGDPVDDDDVATRNFVLNNTPDGGAAGAAGAIAGAAAATALLNAFVATQANLGINSVGAPQIIDGSVGTDELAAGAVDNAELRDGAVDERTLNMVSLAAALAALGLTTPVGTMIDSMDPSTPIGYLKVNGTTIGSAASGATGMASALALPLYTILWSYPNTLLAIQTSTGTLGTRGVSAAADFAANKRMPLHDIRGYHKRAWDDGRGVDTGRAIGSAQADDVGPHTHSGTTGNDSPDHSHGIPSADDAGNPGGPYAANLNTNSGNIGTTGASTRHQHPFATTVQSPVTTETRVKTLAFPVYVKY